VNHKRIYHKFAHTVLLISLIILMFPGERTGSAQEDSTDILNMLKNNPAAQKNLSSEQKKLLLKNINQGNSSVKLRTPPSPVPGRDNDNKVNDNLNDNNGCWLSSDRQSNIERMYNERYEHSTSEPLRQYGYDFFSRDISDSYIPVKRNYRVGPGDTIAVYFWGDPVDILGLNGFYTLDVDRNGKVFVPNLGVFYVWGLGIDRIRSIIHKALSRKFRRFEIEVTLGELRKFPVYVSGFVKKPGIVMASGNNNALDIIALAGGVEKNGSLRNITIKRMVKGKTEVIKIDLYDLLVKGTPVSYRISEGDALFVNPLKKTAAVTGGIKRPAIYELNKTASTVGELIRHSGGLLPSANSPGARLYRYEKNSLRIIEGNLKDNTFTTRELADGDLLVVEGLFNIVENEITVRGHVAYPGTYSFTQGLKTSEIIRKVGILPDTNIHSAAVIRYNTDTGVNFSPLEVLSGRSDLKLMKRDSIFFYPKWMYRPILVTGSVKNPSIIPYYENISLLDVMKNIQLSGPAKSLKAEIFWEREKTFDRLPPDMQKILEKSMFRSMEKEKAFVTSEKTDATEKSKENKKIDDKNFITIYLNDLLVRVTKESNIQLPPGARVFIKKTAPIEKSPSVTMLGHVANPGVYTFRSGETLYDYLKRAGGYERNAYPRGLIFIRRSAQKLQEEQINISFLSMQEYIAKSSEGMGHTGTDRGESAMLEMTLYRYKQMLDIMKKKSELAMGRMALDIPDDLEDLKGHPDNIRLLDGDYIYIPHRPNYVLVLGDVYNQMSLPHNSGKTVKYYINQLGGLAENADRENIYIIKANGKIVSKRQYSSIFNIYSSVDWKKKTFSFAGSFENIRLEEGDTIIVPSKMKIPVMWRPIIKDIAQIMFQSMSTVILATQL